MSRKTIIFVFLFISLRVLVCSADQNYFIDDSGGFGRTFDGIGGLSGGGVSGTFIGAFTES